MSPKPAPSVTTLQAALEHAKKTRWYHCRDGGKSIISQAEAAVRDVLSLGRFPLAGQTVSSITTGHVQQVTTRWYAQGLAPATIQKRLNCLSVLGVNVEGAKVKQPVALKWWLSPEEEQRAVKWLKAQPYGYGYQTLAVLIQWTTRTGLRIEESLRLTWGDVHLKYRAQNDLMTASVTVPGLKTSASQATLPLSNAAAALMADILGTYPSASGRPQGPFSLVTYDRLKADWAELRKAMGWTGNGVTLKALRRSAARYLHITKGMPLDMVRQYLRHEDIQTTMGYLRLTGGINEAEMRKYL